jgi:hypothetical protein
MICAASAVTDHINDDSVQMSNQSRVAVMRGSNLLAHLLSLSWQHTSL